MNALAPVTEIPVHALIIRSTWERGLVQLDALCELYERGAWLGPDQVKQAGLSATLAKGAQFSAWDRERRYSVNEKSRPTPDCSGDLYQIARETGLNPMAIAWHLQGAQSYCLNGWWVELQS